MFRRLKGEVNGEPSSFGNKWRSSVVSVRYLFIWKSVSIPGDSGELISCIETCVAVFYYKSPEFRRHLGEIPYTGGWFLSDWPFWTFWSQCFWFRNRKVHGSLWPKSQLLTQCFCFFLMWTNQTHKKRPKITLISQKWRFLLFFFAFRCDPLHFFWPNCCLFKLFLLKRSPVLNQGFGLNFKQF